ncbi:hypothetical protein LCGC14_2113790 [marine sediment metagenome]|uniref:Uncharacterized protein n=1 Tax=marine sediment metagenome TaxID=412755 RepID=A0A0F9E6D3_9ZZZZ
MRPYNSPRWIITALKKAAEEALDYVITDSFGVPATATRHSTRTMQVGDDQRTYIITVKLEHIDHEKDTP